MKTILIATDFSDAANNAAAYGVELASVFNARVILFSACLQVPAVVSEVPVIITSEEMEIHVQRQLTEEARILGARHNIPVATCCKTGTTARAILEAVKENQVDLIITGMKKSGKQFRRVVGSTVTELIRKIQVPMMVVPEETTFTYISNIALANESDIAPDADRHILDALRELAERFHSKLYLVRATKNRLEDVWEVLNRPVRLSRIMRTLDPVFECVEGEDIPQALTDFIATYNINILALLPHKYSLFERWFIKSTTKAMVFDSLIPLLILPSNQSRNTDDEDIQFN